MFNLESIKRTGDLNVLLRAAQYMSTKENGIVYSQEVDGDMGLLRHLTFENEKDKIRYSTKGDPIKEYGKCRWDNNLNDYKLIQKHDDYNVHFRELKDMVLSTIKKFK